MTEDFPQLNIKEKVTKEDLLNYSKEQLVDRIVKQKHKIDELSKAKDPTNLKEVIEKMKLQVNQLNRRQSYLLYSISRKDQENQELVAQLQEAKTPTPTCAQLQVLLLDPAINLMFQQMKSEVDQLKSKLDQAQKDLAAWKFTPDSQAGKRLMARCRMLLQENEEQSRIIATGRIAKLEGEIAMQKKLIEEMKKNSTETEEFMAEMDEDTEANQATIYLLQQQLKEVKDQLAQYQPKCNNNNSPALAKIYQNHKDSEKVDELVKVECGGDVADVVVDPVKEEVVNSDRTKEVDLNLENHKVCDVNNVVNKLTSSNEKAESEHKETKRLADDTTLSTNQKTPKRELDHVDKLKNRTNKYEDHQKLRTNEKHGVDDNKVRTSDKYVEDYKGVPKTAEKDRHAADDAKTLSRSSEKNDSSRTKNEYKRTEDCNKDKDRHERTKSEKYRKDDEKYRTKDRKRPSVGRQDNLDEERTNKDGSKDAAYLNGISKVRIISSGQNKHS